MFAAGFAARTALIIRLLMPAVLGAMAPAAGRAADSAAWAPNDISVTSSVPGERGTATTRFEVAPQGDARITIDRREGSTRTTGTILLIGGRWMLARGFSGSVGKEIAALDKAVLDSQLVIVLLTAALPEGPPAPGVPQHVRFAEKNNPIRIATASTSAAYPAPWTVVGTVTVPSADAAASYQLSFTYSDQGVARTLDYAGSAGSAKAPLAIPDSMKLGGWRVQRLPQPVESAPTPAQPDSAASPRTPPAATVGELRQRR